jgi:hypothetical protein
MRVKILIASLLAVNSAYGTGLLNNTEYNVKQNVDNYNMNFDSNMNYNRNSNTNRNYNSNKNSNYNANMNYNRNSNKNNNSNRSTSVATGGKAISDSNSISNSNSNAYSGGNSQNVVVDSGGDVRYSGSYRVESVGIAPDVTTNNTAPCRIAVGASGSWIGGALGLFGSVIDEGCDVWRDHENLVNGGYKEAANYRLCDKKEVAKLLPHCQGNAKTEEKTSTSPIH